MEISSASNLNLLVKSGRVDKEQLYIVWENIIRANANDTGNLEYGNYFDCFKQYVYYIWLYNMVKAYIFMLSLRPYHEESLEFLASEGYAVDTTNAQTFKQTLSNAAIASNNIYSKIVSKQKQLEGFKSSNEQQVSFGKALANVSAGIGFEVKDTITLSMYNEYNRIIKQKHGRNRKTGLD